ncbi:14458_t:CDS:2, partial [Ambispora leptoticha]
LKWLFHKRIDPFVKQLQPKNNRMHKQHYEGGSADAKKSSKGSKRKERDDDDKKERDDNDRNERDDDDRIILYKRRKKDGNTSLLPPNIRDLAATWFNVTI